MYKDRFFVHNIVVGILGLRFIAKALDFKQNVHIIMNYELVLEVFLHGIRNSKMV